MKTTTRVVNALILAGYLPTKTTINPLNRCPVAIVARPDYEKFRSEYASLFDLSRELGKHHLRLKSEFLKAGIKPALNGKEFFASFYFRAKIKNMSTNSAEKSNISH